MNDTMSNPVRDSSGSIEEAAVAFEAHLKPQDSAEEAEQPVKESQEEGDSVVEEPEAEAEVEESSEEDQPEAEEEADSEDAVFQIGDEEVTSSQLLDWKANGLRQDDYTRKTQELAQERREMEENLSKQEAALRAEYESKLASVADAQASELERFQNINWDELRETDPYEYQQQWTDYQRTQIAAAETQRRIAEEVEKSQKQRDEEFKAIVAEQAKLVKEYIPELADPQKGQALMSQMSEYLSNEGYSSEEIGGIVDAKAYKVIHKAMQFDALQKGKSSVGKNKVAPKVKVVKPGSSASKATVVERDLAVRQERMNRLKESGRHEDAVDIFRDLIN